MGAVLRRCWSGWCGARGAACSAALREDETAAVALGKSRRRAFRLQAFVIGAMVMGLAGAVYAHFVGFVAPEDFLPILTFQVWTMLVVGGSGNNRGALAGARPRVGAVERERRGPGRRARRRRCRRAARRSQTVLIGVVLAAVLLLRPAGPLRRGDGRLAPRPAVTRPGVSVPRHALRARGARGSGVGGLGGQDAVHHSQEPGAVALDLVGADPMGEPERVERARPDLGQFPEGAVAGDHVGRDALLRAPARAGARAGPRRAPARRGSSASAPSDAGRVGAAAGFSRRGREGRQAQARRPLAAHAPPARPRSAPARAGRRR